MPKLLGKAFSTPSYENEDVQHSARSLNIMTLIAIFILFGLFIGRVINNSWALERTDLIILGLVGGFVISQIIMRIGYVNDASLLFIATAWTGMTYHAFSTAGVRDIAIFAYLIIILVASLLLSSKTALITSVLSLASIWILAFLEKSGKLITNLDTPTNLARDLTILYIILGIVIYLFLGGMRNALQEARNRALELSVFNQKLKDIQTELEHRVSDRTTSLDRRARQVQAAAVVGSATMPLRNIKQLVARVTFLIAEKFGYYHVGIYLLDERNEYVVLQGSNSSAGKRMLDRGYRVKVGEEGAVGLVAATRTARISLDVGDDADFLNDPELPDAHSEMALPLIAGGTILGVLDIQSNEPNAFAEDDIAILQLLADQIALNVKNVLFLQQAQDSLQATRRTYEESNRLDWQQFFKEKKEFGFLSVGEKTVEISRKLDPGLAGVLVTGKVDIWSDGKTISVPVQSRNQTIGVIRLQKPSGLYIWGEEEILDAQNLAYQLGLALENARLLKEVQRRAAREQAIGEISTAISSFSDVDSILRTTVQELGNKLGNTEVIFELGTERVVE